MAKKCSSALALALALAVRPSWTAAAGSLPATDSFSDSIADRLASVVMGWGELGWNTAVKPVDRPAMKLRIGEKEYERGLGHHATGEIVVDLGGEFSTFEAEIGIQWQGGGTAASVVFQVFVDEKKVFDSGVVRERDPARKISIPVAGAQEMRLVATDAGDGIACDCANWVEQRLVRDPAAARRPAGFSANIARFARVVAWDPERREGTRASRIEEMPAEDVFPCVELAPLAGGGYSIAPWKAMRSGQSGSGPASFGLWWYESRFLRQLALAFADPLKAPPAESIRLEGWDGESAWQGAWKPLDATLEKADGRLVWNIALRALPRGTPKIRWVFNDLKQPSLQIQEIVARSRSAWRTIGVRIEPVPGVERRPGQVEVYNGEVVDEAGNVTAPMRAWSGEAPIDLRVLYSAPRGYKGDRTVISFRLDRTSFGIAVEDLLSRDCVHVPHAGIFATRLPAPVTLDAYMKSIAGRKTVLERVREMPEQTLERAFEAVHNPVQDLGPTMLSLACDNRKFVAHRDGTVVFDAYERPDEGPVPIPEQFRLVPRLGTGDPASHRVSRQLRGGWLPAPETTVEEGPIAYRIGAFVAPLESDRAEARQPPSAEVSRVPTWWRDRAVCLVEYAVENRGPGAASVELSLTLEAKAGSVTWRAEGKRFLAERDGRILAWVEAGEGQDVPISADSAAIRIGGQLPAGRSARWTAWIPAWKVVRGQIYETTPAAAWPLFETYWRKALESAMRVEIPDEFLERVFLASQVHCLLAARNEDRGLRVSPWISSDRYGPLESESNSIIRGMGLFGNEDFVRRSLEFFVHRYDPRGFLTTGYTLVGTGEHLWTLGEQFLLHRDAEWLRRVAPGVVRACRWIMEQRAKTKRLDAWGEKAPEHGLFPPGVTADWGRFAYRFFNDGQYCSGVELAGRALGEIGVADAQAIVEDASGYRDDLLRAWLWTRSRSPVVPLESGAWVPAAPAILDCFGNVEDFLPGEDGNRSWAYSIEIGAHHLAALGILQPKSPDVGWLLDYLEDFQFLRSGMGDYPEDRNRRDFFGLGGFAKVQPYYGRVAEVYAMRDEVKPFLRSYFNAIPSLLSRENLSFWEHFHNIGGWNKTHETGWFLCQSRLLFVEERGDELWLLPFAPSVWLRDGEKISVRNAPTRFGGVSFAVDSRIGAGSVDALVEAPSRNPPKAIVLRLRHPGGKPIRAVEVDGRPHTDLDPRREYVRVASAAGPLRIRVSY